MNVGVFMGVPFVIGRVQIGCVRLCTNYNGALENVRGLYAKRPDLETKCGDTNRSAVAMQ